jgi:hypothetical protein
VTPENVSTMTTGELWLRSASPEELVIISSLRSGELTAPNLPLTPVAGTALTYWNLLVDDVRAWAREVARGSRRHRCAEVERWAPRVRARYGVTREYEGTQP